jgi:hypothetical protein
MGLSWSDGGGSEAQPLMLKASLQLVWLLVCRCSASATCSRWSESVVRTRVASPHAPSERPKANSLQRRRRTHA